MINPDQLSPEQIQSIRTWAEEGLDLNAIQKRLHEDLNIKLTFMDTRFLLQDLDIRISQPEPEPEAEPVDTAAAMQYFEASEAAAEVGREILASRKPKKQKQKKKRQEQPVRSIF